MEKHSVERHLSVDPRAYDVEIRRFIPGYEEMLAEGVGLVASLVAPTAHVLDLGGGTGALAGAIAERIPTATVTLLDVDRAMLGAARERLEGFGARIELREGSFLDALPQADAIVASLSLHHIHDIAIKVRVYEAIREALPIGGVFLSLDAAVTDDPRLRAGVFDRWAEHMGKHGIAAEAARAHFEAWAAEDRYFPLVDELTALRRAGFERPECFWRRGPQAVFGALRSS